MVPNDMYAQYLKERVGRETLQTEWGFVSYELRDDHMYLVDLFIVPTHRQNGLGTELGNRMIELAEELKLDRIITTISPYTPGSEVSLGMALKMNFKLYKTDEYGIYLERNL